MKKLKLGIKSFFAKKSTAQNSDASKPTALSELSENKQTSSALLPEEDWQRTIERVEDTPFNLIVEERKEEKRVQIVLGNQIASPKHFENTDEARKYIYSKPYQLMYVMIGVLTEKFMNENR